jgi:hypothetical protein
MSTIKVRKIEFGHIPGPNVVDALVDRVAGSALEALKEAVSNGFDAVIDMPPNLRKVEVSVSAKVITIEDWGTGILEPEDFVQYLSYKKHDDAIKAGKKEIPIGEMHAGKYSYWKLADTITILTNTGEHGYRIKMLRYPPPGHLAFPVEESIGQPDGFLKHRGTKIIITNPKIDNVKNFRNELWTYLIKTCSLKVSKGYKLILNNRTITPNLQKLGEENLELTFHAKDRYGNIQEYKITGHLHKGGAGAVKGYSRDMLGDELLIIDHGRDFSGRVNCDGLTPNITRNKFEQNDVFNGFLTTLQNYVKNRFDMRRMENTKQFRDSTNDYQRILSNYLLEHTRRQKPVGEGEIYPADKKERRDKGETHGTHKPKDTDRTRTPNKKQPENNKANILNIYELQGNDDVPPLRGVREANGMNIIWWNTNHSLMRLFCLKPYKTPWWGSVNNRLAPYFGEIIIEFREEFKGWNYDQIKQEKHKATMYILRHLIPQEELESEAEQEELESHLNDMADDGEENEEV